MKPLENAWNGLVQRKLLPLAILLLAAIVAIPFLLSKDPEPLAAAPATPAAAAGSKSEDSIAKPVVSQVDANAPAERRRVLGAQKNPFEPAPAPKVKASDETTVAETVGSTGGGATTDKPAETGGAKTPSGGSTAPASPVAPTAPVTTPAEPQEKQELYSVTVRFGDSESDSLETSVLPRLKPLPSASDPMLVYLGPGKGGKTAVFVLDESLEPQGDGVCKPSPANCETLHMSAGETTFLDVLDESGEVTGQYQLDVVKIKTRKASASKAGAARAHASKAGLSVLKAREAAVGPLRYRYEAKSGLVRKLDKRAYKALLAKSARIALGTAGGF